MAPSGTLSSGIELLLRSKAMLPKAHGVLVLVEVTELASAVDIDC